MISRSEVLIHNTKYDCSNAVSYHLGAFPPVTIDLTQLLIPLTETVAALTRFDTMLRGLQNSELLLAPLRARDAVVSSRMEGTISTLEEVLRLEANADDPSTAALGRNDTLEVLLYARALKLAERKMADGSPISEHLIRSAHRTLLSHDRGAEKRPGAFKVEQNYISDRGRKRIDFIPIAPAQLGPAMETLVQFMRDTATQPILRTALAHAEFEALRPFDDGNGRVGRMLITLMLWQSGVLSAPHFFVSDYFERNKDEYIERLRAVSASGDWTGWCRFFLAALLSQAGENIEIVGRIQSLHEEMRERLRDLLRSRWGGDVLSYIFANPIFRNNRFTRDSGIPKPTANGFTNRLVEAGILSVLVPPAGRAPGLYGFPALLEIVQEPAR